MKRIFNYYLLCLHAITTHLTGLTPSEKYLFQIGEDQIVEMIEQDELDSFPYNQYSDFFHHIIAQENDHFIGYHATTVSHFIFQEFIRAGLEERYGLEIPEDFYFLRVPGAPEFDIECCREITKRFGRPNFSPTELRQVVIALVDHPIHHLSECHLKWDLLPDDKISRVYSLLLSYAPFMPNREISKEEASVELKAILEEIISEDLLSAESEKIHEAIEQFSREPFADEFGGDIYPGWLPYKAINFPFDDSDGELQNLVVALNISLFGNFSISSESTIHIFAKNESVVVHEQEEFFQNKTEEFLRSLELNIESVQEIYSWVREYFPKNGGVILQFFADPEECTEDLDSFIYVSGFFGEPFFDISVKDVVENIEGEWAFSPELEQKMFISKQLRLVLSNKTSLNAKSGLKIKEYDLIDPVLKQELRDRIRFAIRK